MTGDARCCTGSRWIEWLKVAVRSDWRRAIEDSGYLGSTANR